MRRRDAAWLFGPAVALLAIYAVWGVNSTSNDVAQNGGDDVISAVDIRVIDGDTIEWRGTNYRLEGFDAPETLQADCDAEQAMGESAASMLRSLILGANLIEIQIQPGKDKYGRGIARLLVDNNDVGARLVLQGLARPYDGGARLPWCK